MSTNPAGLPPRYLRTPEASRFFPSARSKSIAFTAPARATPRSAVASSIASRTCTWLDDAAKASTSDPGKVIVLPAKRHTPAELEQARQPRR